MKKVGSAEVENVVRKYLKSKEFLLSRPRMPGETGVDIEATKGKTKTYIEVIGYNTKPQTRSREFFEGFFRVISRDKNNKNHRLAIALPVEFIKGMKQRVAVYTIADKLGQL